jgi:autotransporter translocation and assembly factor TamB
MDALPPPPPPKSHRPWWQRALRIAGVSVASATLLAVLALVAVIGWLETDSGERFVRRTLVSAVDGALAGRLDVGRIRVTGFVHVNADDVRLFPPGSTDPVISVAHVALAAEPLLLYTKRLALSEVVLDHPEVRLVAMNGTTNLAAAVASHTPESTPPSPSNGPSWWQSWHLRAPKLQIRDATFESHGSSDIAVQHLDIDADLAGSFSRARLTLSTHGHVQKPVAHEVSVVLSAEVDPRELHLEQLLLQSEASRLSVTGTVSRDGSQGAIRILDALFAARDVNALVPDAQLASDLLLRGQATLTESSLAVDATVDVPPGSAVLKASVDFGARTLAGITSYRGDLQLKDLEVRRIRSTWPPALLQLEAHLSGAGAPLEGEADASIDAANSRLRDLRIERLHAAAHATGHVVHLNELLFHAADLDLRAHGDADEKEVDLQVNVDAPRLGSTRNAVAAALALHLPPSDGALHLFAHATGPVAQPHVHIVLTSPSVSVAQNQATDLQLTGDLLSLLPQPSGSLKLSAASVSADKISGTGVDATAQLDAKQGSLGVHAIFDKQPLEVVFVGRHVSSKGREQDWMADVLQATAFGVRVAAEKPFSAAFGGGRTSVHGLRLHGDLGRVALDADVGEALNGKLRVEGLQLERFPPALLPTGLKLGGAIVVAADMSGTQASPRVAADVSLRGGRVRDLAGIALASHFQVDHGRVTGKVNAQLASGALHLDVDGPLAWPLPRGGPVQHPVTVALAVEHLSTAELAQVRPGTPPPVIATISGTLNVGGTVESPVLKTRWNVDGLRFQSIDNASVVLTANYQEALWRAQIDARRPDAVDARVVGNLRLPATDLMAGDPLRLASRDLNATVTLERLNLAWLAQSGYGPLDLSGSLSGRVALEGSLDAPEIQGQLKASGVSGHGYQNFGGLLDVDAMSEVDVTADTTLGGEPLMNVRARIPLPLTRLVAMSEAERLEAPFSVRARLAPTHVEKLYPAAAPGPGEPPLPFEAIAGLELNADGSANAPRTHLHLTVQEQQHEGNRAAGTFTSDLDYREKRASLTGLFESLSAGELRLNAGVSADLGAAALQRGGLAATLSKPADVSIDATHLDLALLNGFVRSVRDVGGVMDLHATTSGTLAAAGGQPGTALAALHGKVSLSKAKVMLLGLGSFSDVTLAADGNYPTLNMTTLRGQLSGGSFDGTATLRHGAGNEVDGSLAMHLKNVPVVQDFQTRGLISFDLKADGTEAGGHIHIPLVSIHHGLMTIPERLPRNVQSMDPNPDIEIAHAATKKAVALSRNPTWDITIDKIDLSDEFQVDAPLGTKFTLGSNLKAVISPSLAAAGGPPLELTGKIEIIHGQLSLLQRFEIDQGAITFFPHELEDPTVLVKAHYDGSDATVTVSITGTLRDPQKAFESNPPMTETEILSYLATGQRQSPSQQQDSAALQAQLADATISALGAAALGVVQGAVRQILPEEINPDVLAVEADVQHSNGIGRVRAGKYYLKGRLYVGGQYNPNANPLLYQNIYEGEASYRLGHSDSFRLLVGSEGHDELYFLLEKTFPTARQRQNGLR